MKVSAIIGIVVGRNKLTILATTDGQFITATVRQSTARCRRAGGATDFVYYPLAIIKHCNNMRNFKILFVVVPVVLEGA